MQIFKKNFLYSTVILLSVLVIFYIGFLLGKDSGLRQGKQDYNVVSQNSPIDLSLFWETYNKLKGNFYKPENIDNKKILYGAIEGMVKTLDDPYTEFMEPSISKKFLDDISGQFSGIGIEIGMSKGFLTVVAPLEGTPGQKVGLKSGDKILKIDDKETQDITLQGAVNLIRGQEGTKVKLLVYRDNFKEAKEFDVIRAKIIIPVYKLTKIKEGIYHLQLFNFNENSTQEFDRAIRELVNNNVKTLILDLRNNPGGLLTAAVDMGGWFFDKGVVITKEIKKGEVIKTYYSQGPATLKNIKTIVLLNAGSASASEILAGALKDNLKALIVGSKSFGKGSVQTIEELKDGSVIKYTIAEWARPSGEIINGKGINPDFAVKDSEDSQAKDMVLEKALEFAK